MSVARACARLPSAVLTAVLTAVLYSLVATGNASAQANADSRLSPSAGRPGTVTADEFYFEPQAESPFTPAAAPGLADPGAEDAATASEPGPAAARPASAAPHTQPPATTAAPPGVPVAGAAPPGAAVGSDGAPPPAAPATDAQAQAGGCTGQACAAQADGAKTTTPEPVNETAPPAPGPKLRLGGALTINTLYQSWERGARQMDLALGTFALGIRASYMQLGASAEYRLHAGYNMLHHGYVSYRFGEHAELQLGVHRSPFGMLPYASNSWFFNLTYYVGFEDDYDSGIKLLLPLGDLDIQLAYYRADEGSFIGKSVDSARYSYDLVVSDAAELGEPGNARHDNQEQHQFNARIAYTFRHGDGLATEFGLSGEAGRVRNGVTKRNGYRAAAAAHMNGNYRGLSIQMEALRYVHSLRNPAGVDGSTVVMGAYDFPQRVASEAWVFLANVAYRFRIGIPPFDSLTVYNDFSHLMKSEPGFADSQENVLGALLAAGPVFTYLDFAAGKNHPWFGGHPINALGAGDPDARWHLRANLNVGYYF